RRYTVNDQLNESFIIYQEVSFKHPLKIEIQVYSGHYYALNYNVDKQIFEFEECDPDHYYKD
ncbi:MAG: hypothetical protein ACTTIR_08680, partial [Eggerthia catenaformis]|uniref:hypothetical protein n=1 Tax=Eggerthia catenaformis TaxID=31973 RepID=UPI003FA157B1